MGRVRRLTEPSSSSCASCSSQTLDGRTGQAWRCVSVCSAQLGAGRRGPVFGSPALVRFASSAAAAAAELRHYFQRIPPRSSYYPVDSDPRQETKFRLQEQLLDPIEGDDALLLDLQRLDPRRRFPLRISRQGGYS